MILDVEAMNRTVFLWTPIISPTVPQADRWCASVPHLEQIPIGYIIVKQSTYEQRTGLYFRILYLPHIAAKWEPGRIATDEHLTFVRVCCLISPFILFPLLWCFPRMLAQPDHVIEHVDSCHNFKQFVFCHFQFVSKAKRVTCSGISTSQASSCVSIQQQGP